MPEHEQEGAWGERKGQRERERSEFPAECSALCQGLISQP